MLVHAKLHTSDDYARKEALATVDLDVQARLQGPPG